MKLQSEVEKRLHIAAYAIMKRRGTIADIQNYVVRSAPVIEMVLSGAITYQHDMDWREIREQVRFLTGRATEM